MKVQQNRPPGMNCPECNTFIVMPIEHILASGIFACPNPECSVELKLDARRSTKSLDALGHYAKTMKDLGQPL